MTHLVFDDATPRQGRFLDVQGDDVVVLYAKPAADRKGMFVRFVNLGDKPVLAKTTTPGRALRWAWACGTLEDNRTGLPLAAGFASCDLPLRRVTTIRLLP